MPQTDKSHLVLGAVSFFAVFFLVLLFIFWGAAILSYSSVARKWLRENEKLWILVTAIVVNIVWGRFQNWVVLKAFTVDGIHMKFKSGFYVWEFIVMFSNAASALNSFLFRFVISILSTFFYMGRMDTQTVHGYLSAFSGYGAYTQYVYASYVYKNPVKNAFLALLMKVDEKEMTSVSSRRGDLESGPEYSRHSAKAYEVHTVGARKSTVGRKRLARKLWVAYFIHKNPSLRFYRKQHLTTLLDNVGKE
ncbi:uncharacterized protein EV422DRAFT_514662 [Fimicolochytrium jonesii]|uniref:uncharacterized protein n=1 Tax=Fimicolochytrium jonesii TaxID=1396493 RepID=UPI0022FEA79F|nr:uncharacterized protein EV422DRAFT_514662 [Fimicolochytrium jonesii]KAI8825921.1 hypothetical protein EV422DRAFT_514662 [Fimicolochytrium jonesii]